MARSAELKVILHLDVVDARERLLDGVLDGHDVGVGVVDVVEHRVQGGRLARARGAGDENQALRQRRRGDDLLVLVLVEAEAGEVREVALLAQQTDDTLLAVHHRQRGHAEVQLFLGAGPLDVAVQRLATLGDVHLRHHLHAGDDGRAQGGRRGEDRPQGAVHPEADADVVLVGLDVDVAGALGDRVAKQPLHEVDDGRGIGAPAPFEAERALGAEGAAERLDDLGGGETPRHEAVETALGDHPGLDVPVPRGPHDLLKRLVILRVHHAEHEGAVLHGDTN